MRSTIKKQKFSIFLLMTALAAGLATAAGAQVPSFSKSFNPSAIGPGSVSTLRFDIVNNTGFGVRDLAFTDTFPAGMTLASPANASTTCSSGSVSAAGSSVSLSGGNLPNGFSCSVSVDVTATATGTNVSGDLTSSAGNSGTATATLTVDTGRPGFTKSFSPAAVFFGGRSRLTFTLDNTASSQTAFNMNFTDNLPFGMTVANPANVATTCTGGLITAVSGSSVVSYGFGGTATAQLPAGTSCSISVDVLGGAIGVLGNTSGELISQVGTSFNVSSGKAAATLTVSIEQISLTKEFTDDPVAPGGSANLRFTVRNLDRRNGATNISFTDDLDAALSGLEASALPSNPCGSGSSLSGTGFLTLSGGNLPAEGSCTFDVTLSVPSGAASGTYVNTTSAITADVGGSGVVGDPASDQLFVAAAPLLTKTFIGDPIAAGDSVVLEFTITNTSPTFAATDIAFEDVFDPVIASASSVPAAGFCGASSTATFIPPNANGTATLFIAGASLDPSASCTFSVTLDVAADTVSNTYENVTSAITATVDGETVTGSPASDTFDVVAAPRLEKAFVDDPAAPGGTVTLQFTITHFDNAPGDATDITFSDDLTAALNGLVATGLPALDVCGEGSEIDGTTDLLFTGGSLSPGESCTFSVTLDVPEDAPAGSHTNTTSNIMATVLGLVTTNIPASADLRIAGLTLTKEFTDDPVLPGATVNLSYTIANSHPSSSASSIFFRDDYDQVVSNLAATNLPLSDVCGTGSSAVALNGGRLLEFSGGSLGPGESCSFDVTLQVPSTAAADTYSSVTQFFFATIEGGVVFFDNAVDFLTIAGDFTLFTKDFVSDSAAPGGQVELEFSITNIDSKTLLDLAFTDDLDAVIPGLVSISGTLNDVCGAGSQISGTDVLTFTGGSLVTGASCTFSVILSVPGDAPAGNLVLNTTSDLTGTVVGFPFVGAPASDVLTIDFLGFEKAFGGAVLAGGTVELTFTIFNLSTEAIASDLSFSDDLDAVLSGLVAVGLPQSDVCGTGSSLSGTSFLTMLGGNLLPGGSCTFSVDVVVPAGAEPGDYLNVTSSLRLGSDTSAQPASATLTVSPEADTDGDGVADSVDNCPDDFNPDQTDSDEDGFGDACDVCVFDAGNDGDGDGFCESEGDCNDGDAAINPGAEEVCDGADNDCDEQIDEGFDQDGDGVADCFDVCPSDAGNDADGDGVCASDGDCNDDDAATFPGAPELCDDVDQNCDGELDLGAACDAECGNGLVDVNPLPAPACPNPNTLTVISNLAELDAWIADPTTTADIKEDIDLGGADLVVSTQCDFTTRQGDDLTGIGNAYIAAREIDLNGDLAASGQVTLRASDLFISRQPVVLSSPTGLSVEAPVVDLHGDNDLGDFCVEGGDVVSRQASTTTATGAVILIGDSVDIHSDFANPATFVAMSFGDLILRQASLLQGGDVSLDAAGELDLHGDISATGAAAVSGDPVIFRQACQITGAGSVDISDLGTGILDWHGKVLSSGDVTVTSTAGLVFRQAGRIETNGDVSIDVPDLEARGRIRFNGAVEISADSYELFQSHNFQDNASCTITGTPVPSSKPANGCVEQ